MRARLARHPAGLRWVPLSRTPVRVLALALLLARPVHATEPAGLPEDCFDTLAATRDSSLGAPRHPEPTPDGRSVLYLRSGPRDTRQRLYRFDLATGAEAELAAPDAVSETLSAAEKARRERARMTLAGITDVALSRDGATALITQADRLARVATATGETVAVPGAGWIAPRLSPDGSHVAAVRDNDLHVVDLATGQDRQITRGGGDTLSHGLAEFAAAEELDRADGAWWSPDGATLLYEEADTAAVEPHFIADPEHPTVPPSAFRYPRAGTVNARVRLGLVARDGGETRWVDWDGDAYPYLGRVTWSEGHLSLVVLNRAQTEERVLAVDTATGHAATLLTEADPAWLDLDPLPRQGGRGLPDWLPDGSGFLWAGERDGVWRLELRHADGSPDRVLAPGLAFLAVADLDAAGGSATIVAATADRLGTALHRVSLASGAATPIAAEPGLHDASFAEAGHALMVDRFAGADGTAAALVRAADGRVLATLPSRAEPPRAMPAPEFTTAGPLGLDAVLLRPAAATPGERYPVVLSVYAGPTVKMVERAPRHYLDDQCLADHGFIVVSLDGRGTPGRGRDWERATRGNLIDLPLQDQVDGLRALGQRTPEMDLSRTGVTGWSFGGYFTAMATIRRPDVFAVGVAGAPVVDFADYDTAYTERYLGTPEADPDGYRASDVLTYAAALQRPLLLMHGLTDDNVYFENTVKLTQALIAAGRPYDLLLLPGTHLLPDPRLRAEVAKARVRFLAGVLHPGSPAR
jgi:dipeptidyl-peptidase-4